MLLRHFTPLLVLSAAVGFPLSVGAEQTWGTVASSADAIYLARGGIGEGDDLSLASEASQAGVRQGNSESSGAMVSDYRHISGKGEVAETFGGILPAEKGAPHSNQLPENPEQGPFASQSARGNIVERDEPVLSGNVPLKLAMGLGAVALSSGFDKSGERFGRNHGEQGAAKVFSRVGNALPFIALGGAGLAFLTADDPRLSRTGLASLEAGGGAVLGSLGLKYVIGRSRPEAGAGSHDFHPFSTGNGNSSMPSIHSAAVWGAVTPFAKEYDAPWLYGVAALTNYARVADRKHWVSDTVAGSLIGYLAGDVAWRRNRSAAGIGSQVYVAPGGISFLWPLR